MFYRKSSHDSRDCDSRDRNTTVSVQQTQNYNPILARIPRHQGVRVGSASNQSYQKMIADGGNA